MVPDESVRRQRIAVRNLFLFHRIGTPRAVLTGEVRVWGRRPWRLPTFLRTVHVP
jgi:hypothetical protein